MCKADLCPLANESTNVATLENLFTLADEIVAVATSLLQNPNLPERLLIPCFDIMYAYSWYPDVGGIRKNFIPPEFFKHVFSRRKRVHGCWQLLAREDCPLDVIDKISRKNNRVWTDYLGIASNEKTTKGILMRILQYDNLMPPKEWNQVLSQIIHNPNFPEEFRFKYILES